FRKGPLRPAGGESGGDSRLRGNPAPHAAGGEDHRQIPVPDGRDDFRRGSPPARSGPKGGPPRPTAEGGPEAGEAAGPEGADRHEIYQKDGQPRGGDGFEKRSAFGSRLLWPLLRYPGSQGRDEGLSGKANTPIPRRMSGNDLSLKMRKTRPDTGRFFFYGCGSVKKRE